MHHLLTTLIFLSCSLLYVCAGQQPERPLHEQIQCHPFGTCEPCPDDSLHEPFCQPFGTRRLLHCAPVPAPGGATADADAGAGTGGETPAWEACGRIPAKERADFWEFVLCNALFAGGALALRAARAKRHAALQTRTLAARIGLAWGARGAAESG